MAFALPGSALPRAGVIRKVLGQVRPRLARHAGQVLRETGFRRQQLTPFASLSTPTPPMDPEVEFTVDKIHSTSFKFVLFVTGGASQTSSWLLSVPGASRTILEVRVPYAPGSMVDILGAEPASYASLDTARALAKAAYRHAANLAPFGTDIVGVGCTCALATDRTRKGEHKVFVSTYSGTSLRSYQVLLAKGARDRFHEDGVASRLLLRAVADAAGVSSGEMQLGLLEGQAEGQQEQAGNGSGSGEGVQQDQQREQLQVETQEFDHSDILHELINGRVSCVEFSEGNVYVDAPRRGRIYLPGSFNPLHQGHTEMLQAACRMKPEMEGCFELSIANADKGLLSIEEIQRRVAQFTQAGLPLVLTQAPLFTMKADLFRESLFVVGYDTAKRLVREEYYGEETAMLLQFAKFKFQGCGFLVAGRTEGGKFMTLADMPMPATLQRGGLFEEIPENEFRSDISSTELRAQGRGLASTT